ncbi:MAG: uroporphyrinogen-III C-methyltransferase [Deltaproteobacteria bacterium]
MTKTKVGKVFLVGAGPGDPELLTLKGKRLLQEAQVVVYDRLVNPRILALVPPRARLIFVGKASSRHTMCQDRINALLVKLGRQGKNVVRLKGGDPYVFGRGGEEALELEKAGVPFEVVPGITSAISVPAYAGIPVTQRGFTSSLGIFTGQEDPAKEDSAIAWDRISTGLGTLVFLMGFENLEKIVAALVRHGRPAKTPCCLVRWGTWPRQESLEGTLQSIVAKARAARFSAPAILVVGEVVSLKDKLDWFEKRPLFGKRVLVTVPSDDTGRFAGMLSQQGAESIEFPLISIEPLADYGLLDGAIRCMDGFDWVIFTSQNGVKAFKARLDRLGLDVRQLKGVRVAAIGPRTAEALASLGIRVDITPDQYRQENLLASLKKQGAKGKKFLVVRAQEARDVLPEGLRQAGGKVSVVPAYRTVIRKPGKDDQDILDSCGLVTFTSSSCVQGFVKVFGKKRRAGHIFASIGPVTSKTARENGIKIAIEAKQYTLDGLTDAIVGYYRKHK